MIKLKSLLHEQTTLFKRGMKDPQVGTKTGPIAKIQQKLIDAGMMAKIPGTDYDIYGPKTAAAVKKFQEKQFPNNPKEWDGAVGAKTTAELDKLSTSSDNTNYKIDYSFGSNIPGMSTYVAGADRDEIERKMSTIDHELSGKIINIINSYSDKENFLLVRGTTPQRLEWYKKGKLFKTFSASCGAKGFGTGEQQTTAGPLSVSQKFGEGQPIGTVFAGRKPVIENGKVKVVQQCPGKLEMEGLIDLLKRKVYSVFNIPNEEKQVTSGHCEALVLTRGLVIDNKRSIYIHGTNKELSLGEARSHGCVRVSNNDVIDLFNNIPIGTDVYVFPN